MTETIIIYVQITFDDILKEIEEDEKQKKAERRFKGMFTAKEISIDISGLRFHCVYGTCINGGYVSLINWGVCAELSTFTNSDGYNTEKILAALRHSPDKAWLPTNKKARETIARKLSDVFTNLISEMRCV